MKPTSKYLRQLPDREALKDLDKTGRSIMDYSKLTPIRPAAPNTGILRSTVKPGKF